MAASSKTGKVSAAKIQEYRGQLLDWYDRHAREIPWRVRAGQPADPYRVWLSEIMCQQTTVQAVKPYYLKFLQKWPRVQDLAQAPQEEVMNAWAGLGYYARARNLHKCAQIVANDLQGHFPATQDALKQLPGIGDYTSAAITAIAFNQPANVVDGNVERVMARFFAITEPLPQSKPTLKALAHQFYDGFTDRPGDLAQAFMDLGAGICIPKSPRCILCPLQTGCQGLKQGIAAELPKKIKQKDRPQKNGHIYWIKNAQGQILFHKRPPKGLLGGMIGLPTSAWEEKQSQLLDWAGQSSRVSGDVFHTFTHFNLTLELYTAKMQHQPPAEPGYFWADPADYKGKLPSVFQKAYNIFMQSHA